jgi:hypothetical protein
MKNFKHVKGQQWKKSPSKTQKGHTSTQSQDNPNLQARAMNGDGPGPIPTVLNGVIIVNLNPIHKHIDSDLNCDSTTLLINNLRESINILSKIKLPPSKKQNNSNW